ncbi:hypothetical protein ACFSL4_30265 [Streptomyces caeni]|uniref:DUF3592 domain-containing protein n=1 Tax=Streptomyces caeni TaxID=2307231 RepID=A0ABW4J0D1_9ACTN
MGGVPGGGDGPAGLPVGVLGLLATAGLLVTSVWSWMPSRGTPPGSVPPQTQQTYVEALDGARRALFKGRVTYDDVHRLHFQAGQETRFRVVVSGGRPAPADGRRDSTVYAGADIGVRLACHGDAGCMTNSSRRQPVLTPKDRAEWVWWITPHRAGTVTLTVTSYYRDSDAVLFEKPFELEAQAAASPRGFFPSLWDWLRGGWGVIVGFMTGVGAIWGTGALIVGAVRRRRRDDDPAPGGSDGPPGPSADGSQTE